MYTGLTFLYIHHLFHSEDSLLVHVSMHNCVPSLYCHPRLPPKISLVRWRYNEGALYIYNSSDNLVEFILKSGLISGVDLGDYCNTRQHHNLNSPPPHPEKN